MMTKAIPAAAAQIISSPIKLSCLIKGVVGTRAFTDSENYQHSTGFVRQHPKIKLNSIPYLYNRKKWTGWDDLNPRPQPFFLNQDYLSQGYHL